MIKPDDVKTGNVHGAHRDDPVFEVDPANTTEYPNGDKLPSITISKPIWFDHNGCRCRMLLLTYPFPDHDDEGGEEALYYGGCYYEEGMSYTDPADHGKRVDCFRAAEILYRHSAGRGNAVANLCLGYVYSYDRCEGRYWRDPMALGAAGNETRPYPREERAFACLTDAAMAAITEACYKLGDLYKQGMGCEPNAVEAFSWYMQAFELAEHEPPVIQGSIVLRIASCREEGFGCRQDFAEALKCYKQAAAALEVAVDNGEAWYEKALADARAGVKRCQQELMP